MGTRREKWGGGKMIKWVGGVAVTGVLGVVVSGWGGWKISRINCQGPEGECRDEVKKFLSRFEGKSWIGTRSGRIEEELEEAFAAEVLVRKRWGGVMEVVVKEKRPVAMLTVEGGQRGLLSLDGEVVRLVGEKEGELPEVTVDWQVKLSSGKKFYDERLLNAMAILVGLSGAGRKVSGKVVGESLEVNFPVDLIGGGSRGEEVLVLFPLDRDAGTLVVALQLIWSQSKIDKEKIREIDLRWENPVIKYNK